MPGLFEKLRQDASSCTPAVDTADDAASMAETVPIGSVPGCERIKACASMTAYMLPMPVFL